MTPTLEHDHPRSFNKTITKPPKRKKTPQFPAPSPPPPPPPNTCLHINHPKLEEWLDSPTFGNVTIELQEGKVYAHKEVLAKGSGYFKAMFLGNWGESKSNSISIPHVSYAPFKAMLLYLYSSQFGIPKNMSLAIQVHSLSDFFEVPELKILLEDLIETAVVEKTALQVMSMAEKYSLESLYKKCSNLLSNTKDVQYSAM
eukprot:Phypoly_transcript_21000.p1 GENE.Phypoly_transcript_21000~~Phypoly_transcript_21000.p1  ORF type:complete len:213 (+),score=45.22 Phypoly_transcript_21000:41-640(+)